MTRRVQVRVSGRVVVVVVVGESRVVREGRRGEVEDGR